MFCCIYFVDTRHGRRACTHCSPVGLIACRLQCGMLGTVLLLRVTRLLHCVFVMDSSVGGVTLKGHRGSDWPPVPTPRPPTSSPPTGAGCDVWHSDEMWYSSAIFRLNTYTVGRLCVCLYFGYLWKCVWELLCSHG